MSHILAKQAGMNLRFAYADNDIPDSKLYLVPSVNGDVVMNSSRYKELRKKVADGAVLYISMDNGVFSEFESLTGVRVIDSYEFPEKVSFTFNEKNTPQERRDGLSLKLQTRTCSQEMMTGI